MHGKSALLLNVPFHTILVVAAPGRGSPPRVRKQITSFALACDSNVSNMPLSMTLPKLSNLDTSVSMRSKYRMNSSCSTCQPNCSRRRGSKIASWMNFMITAE